MRIRQLEYLVALEREKHFGRAAEACHVTQPTLSAGLQALEAELGLSLVHREPRFGGLTSEGRALLPWAQRLIAADRDLASEAEALRGGARGTLIVGAIPTALPAVAALTAAFAAARDDVRIEVRSTTSRGVLRGLDSFAFDVGVTYLDTVPASGWRSLPLYAERYLLIGPAGGPLAGREQVGWSALDGLRVCLLTTDMRNRQLLEERFAAAGVRPVVVITTDSPAVLLDHVHAGIPSVVAEAWLAGRPVPEGLEARPLVGLDLPPATVGLVLADRGPARPLVESFVTDARASPSDGAARGA